MSQYLYILAFFLICAQQRTCAQMLKHYLEEGEKNNPALQAAYKKFEATKQKITQAGALPDPIFSFHYAISSVETRVGPQNAKFSLSQKFPWFGTLKTKEKAAYFSAQATYQAFIEQRNHLYYQIKSAYYSMYELHALRTQKKDILAILQTYHARAIDAVAHTKGSIVDVLRINIAREEEKTQQQLLEEELHAMKISFNRLLHRNDTLSVLMDSLPIPRSPHRIDSLSEQHPMLQAIDFNLQHAITKEKIAQKKGLPSFQIGVDYIATGERNDLIVAENGRDAIIPRILINIPIFRAKHKAAKKEAQLLQSVLLAEKKAKENNLISAYEKTEYDLHKAAQMYALYTQQIDYTQQAIQALYSAYSHSDEGLKDILEMQKQRLTFENAQIKAMKNFYIALARRDYLTAKTKNDENTP